jgi:hypothetical protein
LPGSLKIVPNLEQHWEQNIMNQGKLLACRGTAAIVASFVNYQVHMEIVF